MQALSSAQHGYRELQLTARRRFAPVGLPDSEYHLVADVKMSGARTDEIELREQWIGESRSGDSPGW